MQTQNSKDINRDSDGTSIAGLTGFICGCVEAKEAEAIRLREMLRWNPQLAFGRSYY
uniref:Uncharacterized protein n=1 Tax=Manihot esculenta TaxID=3983 RepID=A0A2C9VT78_MANES